MRMKKLSYITIFVVALGLVIFAQPEWTEYSGNPIFGQGIDGGPKAYYPSVLLDLDEFSGNGISAKYKMWYGTESGQVGFSYSNDGITWEDDGLVTGNVRYHCKVLYDADGFGGSAYYYKMWFGDPSVWPYNPQTIKYAESTDGINWVNVQPISQDPLKPLITSVCIWWYGTYGPGAVLYNPDGYGTWNDSDPMGHKYVMYYDTATMNCTPGETESTALAYSLDGTYWKRYGTQPVILSGPTGAWDAEYTYAWSVLKDNDGYSMWYSGGITASNEGLGYATSSDGITWMRDSNNPIFHKSDGNGWRNSRTYCPSVIKDGSTYKMWFSGKGSVYSIGYATAAPPECVPPPPGLVSWWPGDGNADDIVGGNNGTLVGGATFVSPGKVGDAFTFSGSGNDYVRVLNNPSLEPTTITVDAWVKADVLPLNNRYIVAKGAQGCTAASYAFYTSGRGLSFYVFNGSWWKSSPNAGTGIWDRNWHHIAGTYDGSSVRLYVDGAEVGSGTPASISIGYNFTKYNDLLIGKYEGCLLPFMGDIDEVEIFNRALTASEIQAIHSAGSAGKCKNEPPIAVCNDFEIHVDEKCQANITPEDVDGGSDDPDEGDTISLSLDNTGPFSPGVYAVYLTVTDESGESDTCQAMVTVNDTTPPVPDLAALPPVTGECSVTITSVPTATDNCAESITGTTSDPLSYSAQGTYTVTWTYDDGKGNATTQTQNAIVEDTTPPVPDLSALLPITGECSVTITSAPTATDNCVSIITGITSDPLSYTEQGTYTVTWTYDDGNGNTTTQTQTVVVEDTTPPEISVSVSPDTLRPPNHKMVNIIPNIVVSDNCDSDPTVVVTSVEMNEGDGEDTYHPIYDSTLGAGHTTDDIQMDDDGNIWNIFLRAERSGKGTGRIYVITYTATDALGNSATATATVTVPHDK